MSTTKIVVQDEPAERVQRANITVTRPGAIGVAPRLIVLPGCILNGHQQSKLHLPMRGEDSVTS